MAIAPEVVEAASGSAADTGAAAEGAPWHAVSQASGQLRRAPSAGRHAYGAVSTPSAAARTINRLIWAVAVGLIVLEIAAEATGQRWSFALPSLGRGPAPKSPYVPLYTGQNTSSVAAAMPAVFGGVVAMPAPLSNRSAGNQALG